MDTALADSGTARHKHKTKYVSKNANEGSRIRGY